ncbi:hypothetical protein [Geosporobacter ferrireducens]|uniref:Uncharacterized protein n=1 Tax=Geosporobacter ferrireducens TaxID=1424294 RepID=A0A1D8GIB0_9FIRM|nr:hypothetical protein [Geosporobacter ferrireducens]AOT70630.1 hypothetical protein Gferi_14250 [Geosporobacter ferrireducens]MTI57426.1 hypothetical protein [Geosporobacter ferrireducens]
MSSQLDALLDIIEKAPDGLAKIPLIEEAIRLADCENNLRQQLALREQLIYQSGYYGDAFKIITTFPRYLSLIDENSDKVGRNEHYDLLWAFKYVINNGISFYQIPWEKIYALCEEFKNRCIQYGYSLRFYYFMQAAYGIYFSRDEEIREFFSKYQSCKRDRLSNCEACELSFDVACYLHFDQLEEALETAKPLFSGEKKCGHVPHETYQKFLYHYVTKGKLEEAEKILDKSYKLIYKNQAFLGDLDGHLLYYAITDPIKGIKIFSRHLQWVLDSKKEWSKLSFYAASWMLWENVSLRSKRKEYVLKLPQNAPFTEQDGKYKVEEIMEHCKNQALSIAAKFDKRDGQPTGSKYIDEIRTAIMSRRGL